ncbi:MAG: hypothetical protein SNJ59_04320 [Aggregatilineales bacterium]
MTKLERIELRAAFNEALQGWDVVETGRASVRAAAHELRLMVEPGPGYSNAQISDYGFGGRMPYQLRWRPPLVLTVTARASAPGRDLRGTAGFGFWNHPFSPDARRLRLPRAIWFFFGAPPSNMALAHGVPGSGWKAATIDAARPRAWALAPLAPAAVLLMRVPRLYNLLWPRIQQALCISEAVLSEALLAERHTYRIDWRVDEAFFSVDDAVVLHTPFAPRGPAGFVAWIDTQYAIVTPQGRFGFGITSLERPQALAIERLSIEPRG